jgi:GT2 family glycosyltransferase
MTVIVNKQTDIVIVSYNSRRHVADCIQSIIACTALGSYQIRVVDNASVDGSQAYLRLQSRVKTIYNRTNSGYGGACNQGIVAGRGRYIFLLNSDVRVTANWLPPLIQILAADPKVAVVAPKLVNPAGYIVGAGVVGSNARPVVRGRGEPAHAESYNRTIAVLSVCGACMGIKRELLPELGLFDENYFHYFEETDYCYNARRHGYQVIYCPASTVVHYGQGSCQDRHLLNRYYQTGRVRFEKKWADFLNDPTEYGGESFTPTSLPS